MYLLSKIRNTLAYLHSGHDGIEEKGKDGLEGDKMYEIHYSPITDSNEIKAKITNSESLSDNESYNSQSVSYRSGDNIIDMNGNIYKISISGESITLAEQTNLFETDFETLENASAKICTEYGHAYSTLSNVRENEKFIHEYSNMNSSPYAYHRHYYYEAKYGNWIKFDSGLSNSGNYDFTFSILFENGYTISSHSNSGTGYIFIDNHILRQYVEEDTESDALRDMIKYNGIENNFESLDTVTIKYAELIKSGSVFKIEMENKSNGEIRYKFGEII